ncbi:hypothetical protein J6590_027016 [Homalodisca vitripennis]|nr:hypothetical protein J6590_027016 [Homalodisca vitripennis]
MFCCGPPDTKKRARDSRAYFIRGETRSLSARVKKLDTGGQSGRFAPRRGGFGVKGWGWVTWVDGGRYRLVIPMATSPLLFPTARHFQKARQRDRHRCKILPPAATFINYLGLIAGDCVSDSGDLSMVSGQIGFASDLADSYLLFYQTTKSPIVSAGIIYQFNYNHNHLNRYAMDLNGARRKNATRETTSTLKAWLNEHKKNPYPTKGEKIMLAIITKMTLTQVSTWFANARRRLKKENKMTWEPRNRVEDEDNNNDEVPGGRKSADNKDNLGNITFLGY